MVRPLKSVRRRTWLRLPSQQQNVICRWSVHDVGRDFAKSEKITRNSVWEFVQELWTLDHSASTDASVVNLFRRKTVAHSIHLCVQHGRLAVAAADKLCSPSWTGQSTNGDTTPTVNKVSRRETICLQPMTVRWRHVDGVATCRMFLKRRRQRLRYRFGHCRWRTASLDKNFSIGFPISVL